MIIIIIINKKNKSKKINITQSISYEKGGGYTCNNLTEYWKKKN